MKRSGIDDLLCYGIDDLCASLCRELLEASGYCNDSAVYRADCQSCLAVFRVCAGTSFPEKLEGCEYCNGADAGGMCGQYCRIMAMKRALTVQKLYFLQF